MRLKRDWHLCDQTPRIGVRRCYHEAVWTDGTRNFTLRRNDGSDRAQVRITDPKRGGTRLSDIDHFDIDPDEPWEATKARMPDWLMEMLL